MRTAKMISLMVLAFGLFGQNSFGDDGLKSIVVFSAPLDDHNEIVKLVTHTIVPEKPRSQTGQIQSYGTLFLWPGLQASPQSENFMPINNGVLQPVLTWGPSCAPGAPQSEEDPTAYSSWWVSGQYVNFVGSEMGYMGCLGGDPMRVNPGDHLKMTLELKNGQWIQTICDEDSTDEVKDVKFRVNLKGQKQNFALFAIETFNNGTISQNVEFNQTEIYFSQSNGRNCSLVLKGNKDIFSDATLSEDQKICSIEFINLRADSNPLIQSSTRAKMKTIMSAKKRVGAAPSIQILPRHGAR